MAEGEEGHGAQGQPSTSNSGSRVGDDELATVLSELARSLQQESDTTDTLEKIVSAAVELIPGVDEGSISVVLGRKKVESRAASSDLPQQVDAAQDEEGEGPCLDAVFEQQTVRVPDMSTETRWPAFSRRALEAGAGSMLSFQLYVEGDNLGALNLYAHEANAFTDDSEHVGLLFAAHAAVAFAGARKQEQLAEAMVSRGTIGQAMGMLMERYKISSDQAFALLVRLSQHRNHKLSDVAGDIVRGATSPSE